MSEFKRQRDLEAHCNTDVQMVIFCVGFFLFLFWYSSVFKSNEYNTISLTFCVFILLWLFCNLTSSDKKDDKRDDNVIDIPPCLKCLLPLKRCDDEVIESVTVAHFLAYTIIGYLVPNLYMEIFLISITFEFFEGAIGYTAKIVVDPIVNMLGYLLGSYMSPNNK